MVSGGCGRGGRGGVTVGRGTLVDVLGGGVVELGGGVDDDVLGGGVELLDEEELDEDDVDELEDEDDVDELLDDDEVEDDVDDELLDDEELEDEVVEDGRSVVRLVVGLNVSFRRGASGKSSAFSPLSAAFMKEVQISVGKVPPVRLGMPLMFFISSDVLPPSDDLKMPTDAVSCGVKPLNHTARLPLAVPVLPAAGRPRPCVPSSAEPYLMTSSIASRVFIATARSNTRFFCGLAV